jgi:hypothetical protein
LLLPLGSLAVSVLYAHSAWLVLSKHKVSWKGRQYLVNTSKAIEDEDAVIPNTSIQPVPAAPTDPNA